jgi:hypothetical protein
VARKPNYDFERRRKEQERKAKKDAKDAARKQRKLDIAAGLAVPDEDFASAEDYGAPASTESEVQEERD